MLDQRCSGNCWDVDPPRLLSGGLQTVDLPLTPVQPFSPLIPMAIPALGEQPELILKLQRFTAPFDMTGNPTITLAAGFSKARLPIAIQLVAYDHHELELICAGRAFQRVTDWHRQHPIGLAEG